MATLCISQPSSVALFPGFGVKKVTETHRYRFCVEDFILLLAVTLLVGRQEGHPACKNLSGGVLAWLSVWSEVQTCIWLS